MRVAHSEYVQFTSSACLSGTDRMVRVSKELSYLLRHKPPSGAYSTLISLT